jgi:septal ring factor EnvC (AmiA/AmiB activator)
MYSYIELLLQKWIGEKGGSMSHSKQAGPNPHHQHDHTTDGRLCKIECTLEEIEKALKHLLRQGDQIMSIVTDLEAKVDALEAADAAREARDVAQDAVTAEQITVLQASVDELKAIIAAGTLSAEDKASAERSAAKIDAVITSLNAADPTSPVA